MDFHSKITISNYSDIRSVYHSNYSNTKFHIRFSSNDNRHSSGMPSQVLLFVVGT